MLLLAGLQCARRCVLALYACCFSSGLSLAWALPCSPHIHRLPKCRPRPIINPAAWLIGDQTHTNLPVRPFDNRIAHARPGRLPRPKQPSSHDDDDAWCGASVDVQSLP